MIKEIIFFDDVDLYNRCEVHAKRNGLLKGSDFIVFATEKYFTQQGKQVSWKKPIDMWLSCEPEARKLGVTISAFIEGICKIAIDGVPTKDNGQNRSLLQKISDIMTLPKG